MRKTKFYEPAILPRISLFLIVFRHFFSARVVNCLLFRLVVQWTSIFATLDSKGSSPFHSRRLLCLTRGSYAVLSHHSCGLNLYRRNLWSLSRPPTRCVGVSRGLTTGFRFTLLIISSVLRRWCLIPFHGVGVFYRD